MNDDFDLELMAATAALLPKIEQINEDIERVKYKFRMQFDSFNLNDEMQKVVDCAIDSIRTSADVDNIYLLMFHVEPPPLYNPLKMVEYRKKNKTF